MTSGITTQVTSSTESLHIKSKKRSVTSVRAYLLLISNWAPKFCYRFNGQNVL